MKLYDLKKTRKRSDNMSTLQQEEIREFIMDKELIKEMKYLLQNMNKKK